MKREVIYGPPGCGKTHQLAKVISKHLTKPDSGRVLFTSHTKAAAQTALERVGLNPRVDTSTLHSFCFKELRMSRAQTVDDLKLEELFQEFGLDADEGGDGKKYQEVMSLAASAGVDLFEAYERSGSPGTRSHFESFEKSYRMWKDSGGFLDFCDMLARYLTIKKPSGHALLVIDEAQDMTPLHWKVVRHFILLNPRCGVVVAGDDDQCLYAYAGADPHGMVAFQEGYRADATILKQSFRVPRQPHAVAQKIAGRMGQRVEKEYAPTKEEGSVKVFGDFNLQVVKADADTLILFNDKFVRKDVEELLIDAGLAYTATGGYPAPMQTKGAKAVKAAHGKGSHEAVEVIRRGLNEKGIALFNSVGIKPVVAKIREGDHSIINFGNIEWLVGDYFQRVDWKADIKLRISTIHGAKGMEADEVHLLLNQSQAAVDYSFADPDAQHRLMYVGVTRARKNLMAYEGENGYDLPQP